MTNTTISFSAYCRGCFDMDSNGSEYKHLIGGDYVPTGIGIGGGDYFEIDVDLETGQVIGWDAEKMKAFINK